MNQSYNAVILSEHSESKNLRIAKLLSKYSVRRSFDCGHTPDPQDDKVFAVLRTIRESPLRFAKKQVCKMHTCFIRYIERVHSVMRNAGIIHTS